MRQLIVQCRLRELRKHKRKHGPTRKFARLLEKNKLEEMVRDKESIKQNQKRKLSKR